MDEPGFPWWDHRARRYRERLGLRIDHALVAESLTERLCEAAVDRSYRTGSTPSDHVPLVVDLD